MTIKIALFVHVLIKISSWFVKALMKIKRNSIETLSKLFTCVLLDFGRSSSWSFFIQDLHLKFHSFLGFWHGSGSSVKAIMPLSATLPLAIGLKCFWFLIALLVYPKSTILGLSFLNPKDLCLPNQFLRGSWQKRSVSTYLTWCQRRNWVASMI